VKRYVYRERDYAFAQLMLTLRTAIGLSQAVLAERLGASRRAVADWEGGLSYPKTERLKELITLGMQQQAFPAGREEEEIRALWKAAHQKVLLDDAWLHDLLAPAMPIPLSPPAGISAAHEGADPVVSSRVDLVEALDVSHFVGREVEVAELSRWIVQEHCRLVTLLGIGGIGKSTLASYVGSRLAPHFEAVLWRSLRDAPECSELVADCITFFSETTPAEFPTSLEQRITQLVARLQASRCLLVLDNLETLLASGDPEGGFLPGYEGYGRLIERLAESAHQSCVLLTSRERPREIEALEGTRSPVRSLRLVGVDEQTAHVLLSDKGLDGTPAAWQRLVAGYAGNPLALKIVAQAISDLFDGDLDRFLQEGELIFNGVRPLLRQQVGRLSPLEHLLLTWLAVLREWTSLDTLVQVLHPRVLRSQVLEALEALSRRSLVERGQQASFSLQSVVMEYLSDELGEHLSKEIVLGDPQQLVQPSQGTHPPGAGVSSLEHALEGHATVLPERGLFLATTHRMHPDVCAFISEIAYEGRLHAEPGCEVQRVLGEDSLSGTGLRYIAVEHEGNRTTSPEEVEVIASEFAAMLGRRWIDKGGVERPLTSDDILVVAPYNAHVARVVERLPAGARVGTVDKFQGQEAAVVFYSMASSGPEDMPRNLEFLYSLNRLNVAMSRARCLAVLVASPQLLAVRARTVKQARLAAALDRLVLLAAPQPVASGSGDGGRRIS